MGFLDSLYHRLKGKPKPLASIDQASEEEIFRIVLENLSVGIAIADPNLPDNPIVYANPGYKAITGYDPNEIQGRNPRYLQGPLTDPATRAKLREAVSQGRPCRVELVNYRKDGSSFWNEVFINPIRDAQGRLRYFVALKTDTQDRHDSERKIKALLETSERDNDLLRVMERAQRDFFAMGTHDLRTPVTAISGFLKLLENEKVGPLNEAQREMVATARRNADRLLTIVNDLLEIGKIESEGIRLDKRPTSLPRLMAEAAARFKGLLEEKRITLSLDCPEDGPEALVDPAQLNRVLGNLLGNAVKFTPQDGAIKMTAAPLTVNDQTGRILSVMDNGPGIPPADLEKVFEKFYRVPNQATRDAVGTGLGLPICKRIVEAHGGKIWAENLPGGGTALRVFLPD